MPIKLNDDRQGEGGTLAVINVNITTGIYFVQVFWIRKILISRKFFSAPSRNRTYI